MKKLLLAATCVIGLSGCEGMNPQSGTELLAMAETTALVRASTYRVERSATAVAQSWRAGAAKCLNRQTQTTGVVGYMPIAGTASSMPIMGTTIINYQSSVQPLGGGRHELTVRMLRGSIFDGPNGPQGTIMFAAIATPEAGGSRINDAMGVVPFPGQNPIPVEVRAWAEGSSTACPNMP